MSFYETVYILRSEFTDQQVHTLNNELKKIIEDLGGKIHKMEHWGLLNFAYKIKKRKKGHYCLMNIEANPEQLKELDRKMSLNENIVRSLSIKVEKLNNEPSIMMQKKEKEYSSNVSQEGNE